MTTRTEEVTFSCMGDIDEECHDMVYWTEVRIFTIEPGLDFVLLENWCPDCGYESEYQYEPYTEGGSDE